MERCERCLMPFTKPGLIRVGDLCGGCINYDKRTTTDWFGRQEELRKICDTYRSELNYDCMVAVSGGKDSYWIVKTIVEDYDMHPLLVTINDNFKHTETGNHNLKNLINQYGLTHYAYTISNALFVDATRYAFEELGNPLKYIEYAIYTKPYELAKNMGIPLVFFGEDSAWQYGTSTVERDLTNNVIWYLAREVEKEIDWWLEGGLDLRDIYNVYTDVGRTPSVYFMSYFYPWSSVDHLYYATKMGFKTLGNTGEWHRRGVIEDFEQIDSYGYLAHLWLRYPRHGYQRTTDIVSRRIREGQMTKQEGKILIDKNDHLLDPMALENFCDVLGYTEDEFWEIVETSPWNQYYFKE
jgi:N-acetyl sugar amidotransferase